MEAGSYAGIERGIASFRPLAKKSAGKDLNAPINPASVSSCSTKISSFPRRLISKICPGSRLNSRGIRTAIELPLLKVLVVLVTAVILIPHVYAATAYFK